LRATEGKLQKLEKGTKGATKKTNLLGSAFKALGPAISVGAVVAAGKAVVELGALGAKAESLERSLSNLSGGARAAEQYIGAIQTASKGTIAEMDAMQMAITAQTLGVTENADEMGRLTEIAVTLGKAQGLTATQAVSDLTTALGRQSPMILDNLGITMKLSDAYEGYATKLGKSASQLTDAEKKQAFLNEALERGADVAEQLGGVIEDSTTKAEQGAAAWKDLRVEIGKHFSQAVGDAKGATGGLTKRMGEFLKFSRESGKSMLYFGNQLDYFNYVVTGSSFALDKWNAANSLSAGQMDDYAEMNRHAARAEQDATKAMIEHAVAAAEFAPHMKDYDDKFRGTTVAVQSTADAMRELRDTYGAVVKEAAPLEDAIAPLERLGDLEFDNQALWQLAMASGASAEALGELAVSLGIANENEVALAQAQQRAIEEFGKTGNVEAYTEAMRKLYASSAEVIGVVQGVIDRLNAMPSEKVIKIRTELSGAGVPETRGGDAGAGQTGEFRQHGGPVEAGQAYVVGEKGPELFVPASAGQIVPNAPAKPGRMGGGAMTINVNVNAPAFFDSPEAVDMLAAKMAQGIRQQRGSYGGYRA